MTDVEATPTVWESGQFGAPPPPVVQGAPLLGSALNMMTDPVAFLVEAYATYGPVFEVKALNRRFTVLAGPEANLFMSREGDAHLSGSESWHTFADEINSKYFLAAIDGEDHSRMRKVLKKPYSKANILRQADDAVAITRLVTAVWQPGQSFVVFPTMQRMIAEQIGHLLLGKGPEAYFDDFVVFMRTLLNAVLGQRPKLTLRLPGYTRSKARVMELADTMLAEHRQGRAPDEEPDLIDYLLEAARENPDIFTEPELQIGALGPYLAGIDTAAGTSSFMLYALLSQPEIMARLRPEIDAVLDDGPLTASKIREMTLLQAATIETLRLYPVAPMLPRSVVRPFTFAGHQLEVGTPIMVATAVAHFDPTLYPDPYRFDLDRCLPPRKEHRQPGALAPYGGGAHTCAGAGFAEVEIMLTIATLLRDFDLALEPADYRLKMTFSPAPAPTNEFRMRVVGRRT